LEVHDSVIVEARAGSTIFVVRRVQTNEALIALIFCALRLERRDLLGGRLREYALAA